MVVLTNIPIGSANTTSTWDDRYEALWNTMQSYLHSIARKQNTYSKIGKDVDCFLDELFYFSILAEYIIDFREAIDEDNTLTRTEYNTLYESYSMDCIREVINCRYGKGNLFDRLLESIDAQYIEPIGIGFMEIQNDFIIA